MSGSSQSSFGMRACGAIFRITDPTRRWMLQGRLARADLCVGCRIGNVARGKPGGRMAARLQGKVAIVSGAGCVGPGWGNGRAMAVIFAQEGAKVFAADKSRDAMT